MTEITNVNLLFQRRARGAYALPRYAATNEPFLFLVVPDEMEARTLHLVRFDVRGVSLIQETFSVETLRRLEASPRAGRHVGITEDDLYLFRDGHKTRLLADRRASLCDISVAEDGQRFAAAYSDMLASGYALVYGDTNGRLLWTRDLPFAASRVAVPRAGHFIAVAGETGELWLLGADRTVVQRFRYETPTADDTGTLLPLPITAVATGGPGRTFFGTQTGVGALDEEGRLAWFTELGGTVVELALDDDAGRVGVSPNVRCIAALLQTSTMSGRLVLLDPEGSPVWDVDYETARPTGVSLSPDGRICAVSLKDGTLALYLLEYGQPVARVDIASLLQEAEAARSAGNFTHAIQLLQRRVSHVLTDEDACRALGETLHEFREQIQHSAQTSEAVHDFAAADSRFAEYLTLDPSNAQMWVEREQLRRRWAVWATNAGQAALTKGDTEEAESCFLRAVSVDPLNVELRQKLGQVVRAAADAALTRGKNSLRRGEWVNALAAFEEAQNRGVNGPHVSALVREARAGEALELGNTLYRDREYSAALFQFKKVLRLDPDNREAQQRASYAQSFLQDNQIAQRFSRLE